MTVSFSGPGLSAIAVLTTAAFLSACSSSGSDSNTPANDQAGGQGTATPAPGNGEAPGSVTEPGSGTDTAADPVSNPDGGDTGEPNGPVPISGQVNSLGLVRIDQVPGDSTGGSVFGSFFQSPTPLPADQLISNVIPTLDTCTVFRGTDIDPDADVPDIDIASLDAGEALVLSSPQGTWLTLLRQDLSGFTLYRPADRTLPLPVPMDLVVDIPGAQYPAYPNVRIPNVTPLTGVVATPGSNDFSWQAGNGDPEIYIGISLFGSAADNTSVSVVCNVVDDGQFSLPADIQAQVGPGFVSFTTLQRIGARAEQRGDSVLLVTHSIEAQ